MEEEYSFVHPLLLAIAESDGSYVSSADMAQHPVKSSGYCRMSEESFQELLDLETQPLKRKMPIAAVRFILLRD